MPWMDEGSRRTGERSYAGLVRSGGQSPAGNWIIDPNLPALFQYPFAGWPRSSVVIAKGTIVAVGDPVRDYRTLAYRNVLTIANGSNNPVGVAPYNYMRRFDENGNIMHGFFEADDQVPGIITRDYITVPYVPNPTDAGLIYWGLATNHPDDFGWTDQELKAGDYVKPNANGKFVKWHEHKPVQKSFSGVVSDGSVDLLMDEPIWSKGHGVEVYIIHEDGVPELVAEEDVAVNHASGKVTVSIEAGTYDFLVKYESALSDPISQRVGQVLEIVAQIPPEGWLKWVTPEPEERGSMRREHTPTSPTHWEDGYGYSKEYKWPTSGNHESPHAWREYRGIPGLTDGSRMAQTNRIENFVFPKGETTQILQLNKLVPIDASTIQVEAIQRDGDRAELDTVSLNDDRDNKGVRANKLTVKLKSPAAHDLLVRVTYKVTDTVGVPAGWDFIGSVGAAHILLQK